ncbi:MAG: hypothetical protein HZA04_07170 [Nitrospinae bacterium]|nr:hypothetical protein [Nitrospinota bacterium]
MKKAYLFMALFLALATPAFAQEPEPDDEKTEKNAITFINPDRGGAFYLLLGTSSPDVDSLNQRLETAGYSKLSQNFTTVGFGGHAILDKWVVGGEIQGLAEKSSATSTYRTRVNGGYLLVNVGYTVYEKPSLRVFPQAGLGFGTLNLSINETSSPTFDQTLADPKRGAALVNSSMLLNLGIAADGIIAPPESGKGGFWVFGFRAGYLFTIYQDGWRNIEGASSGGPSAGFTGPYLQVVLGGGFYN